MKNQNETAVLLLSCPDQKGIVAEVSMFIFQNRGNIIHSDQHTDVETSTYFMRIEWEMEGFQIPKTEIGKAFSPIAEKFSMDWSLHFSAEVPKIAVFVSQFDHCLYDVLLRQKSGEIPGEIRLIISNHTELKGVAEYFGVEFREFAVTKDNKAQMEQEEIRLLQEKDIDLVILARYMQILSPAFVSEFRNRIINIHHSFLPAFVGARPYHQAHARGVKIIGATSHYVTADLDQGPIIAQDVVAVSHRESVDDLIRKGRDLEKLVLSRAVKLHLENKVLVFSNKTVVFD